MPWTSGTTIAYARWVIRWRWLVLFAALAAAGVSTSGLRFVTFTTNYRAFLSKENPLRQSFDALQAIYTRNDNILFALRPNDGTVFTPAVLAAVRELTDAGWRVPYSTRVDSITNFQHTYAEGDDLTVEDLVPDPDQQSAADLARIRTVAFAEPLLINRLISTDGSTTGVNVTLHLPETKEGEVVEAMAYARDLADDFRARHPDIRVAITGFGGLSNAFVEATIGDFTTLVPIMYGLILLTMLVSLRSVMATVATLLVIGLSAATAMGLTGWFGIQLSPPAANAPTIIITIAVADSIHILVSMFKEMRRGQGKREALVESLRINMQPVFLTSLTTVIGFLSLNFSDAPPFRDLGNISALGIAIAWAYSLTLLPALIAVMPFRRRSTSWSMGFGMERLAEFVVTRRRVLLWGMATLVVLLGVQIPRIELYNKFVEFFDRSVQFRVDTDFTMEHLTGIYQIDYSLEAGNSGGVSDPAYLAHVDEFADWFRQQPGVLHVSTVTDTMKRLNRNMHGDESEWYRLPESRPLAAQYLLLYEMSLPYGLDLNNQINVDKSATRFTVTTGDLSTPELRSLKERGDAWLVSHTPSSMHGGGTGPAVIFAYQMDTQMVSMLRGTVLAILLICFTLCIALRSVKMGLLSMVPNIVPPVIGFGIWAILYGRAGLPASFVTVVALGIIVDDTVHFTSKYLRARREQGLRSADAVRYAFSTVGSALVITSVILAAGFGVLAFSAFDLNATMGLLTAIMIIAALLADFLLFPPLLMAFERRTHDESASVAAHAA
jgi:predicted RND superfamily exporter protein